jgi:hypothetical protein
MSHDSYAASSLAHWLPPKENTCQWQLPTVVVTSLHLIQLHGHKENCCCIVGLCVLRALPSSGFTCHIIFIADTANHLPLNSQPHTDINYKYSSQMLLELITESAVRHLLQLVMSSGRPVIQTLLPFHNFTSLPYIKMDPFVTRMWLIISLSMVGRDVDRIA